MLLTLGDRLTSPTSRAVVDDPVQFAAENLWIIDKDGNLVRLIYNAAQRIYLANRTSRDLIVKPRQIGYSTAIKAEYFRDLMRRTVGLMTITDKDDNTQAFRIRVDRFYNEMPDEHRPRRKYANASMSTFPDTDSVWSIATAGGRGVGRSRTLTHIHGSEFAFWPDPKDTLTSLLQAGNPAVVLETTPNGAFGYAWELIMETLGDTKDIPANYFVDGPNGWRLHVVPWWIHEEYAADVPPDFLPDSDARVNQWGFTSEAELMAKQGLTPGQIMWRRNKIANELQDMFLQEYLEDPRTCFLVSGQSYFGALTGAFTVPADSRQYQIGHRYCAGLDFGQEEDYTVLVIIDATAREMVYMYRARREPWAVMRGEIVHQCKQWHIETLEAEKNSMGSTNIEALRDSLSADGLSTQVNEFTTTSQSKTDVMVSLRRAVQELGLKLLNDAVLQTEMKKFQRVRLPGGGWRLAAPASEHDDTVIALALANKAAEEPGVSMTTSHNVGLYQRRNVPT